MDRYFDHLDVGLEKNLLPPDLKRLVNKIRLEELSSEKVIEFALEDFDLYAKSIEGRLNAELSTFLRGKIKDMLAPRVLRLRRAHAELRDEWGDEGG